MIKCIHYEPIEGWCMNQELDMYMDYPSEHYCYGCYHYREEQNADEKGLEPNQKIENDNRGNATTG